MEDRGMHLFKNSWIGLVQPLNGQHFSQTQRSLSSNLHIQITIRFSSLCLNWIRLAKKRKFLQGLREMGIPSKLWGGDPRSMGSRECCWQPYVRLFAKIKRCRLELVQWSWNIFWNFNTQMQSKQLTLEDLSIQNNPKNLPTIRTLKHEINTLLNQDEIFWCQRSRSIWLPVGDKNTNFFHQRASQHCQKNHISEITSQSKKWCTFDD